MAARQMHHESDIARLIYPQLPHRLLRRRILLRLPLCFALAAAIATAITAALPRAAAVLLLRLCDLAQDRCVSLDRPAQQ